MVQQIIVHVEWYDHFFEGFAKIKENKMSKVEEFREAVNANEDWQEEVRNFGADDSIVNYASGKGYEFTNDEYSEYLENNTSGELSEFEQELVAGGCKECGEATY